MPNRFEIVKKGYDPAAVDEYIETLEAVIKSYKEKDSAIKNAILNAQLAADNIVKNAETRSEEVKLTATRKIHELMESLAFHKQNLTNFKTSYNVLIRKYIRNINNVEFLELEEKIEMLEKSLKKYYSLDDSPNDTAEKDITTDETAVKAAAPKTTATTAEPTKAVTTAAVAKDITVKATEIIAAEVKATGAVKTAASVSLSEFAKPGEAAKTSSVSKKE